MRLSRLMFAISVALALFFGGMGTIEGIVAAMTGTPWQPALVTFGLLVAGVLQMWKGWVLLLVLAWGECVALAAFLLPDAVAMVALLVSLTGLASAGLGWLERRREAEAELKSLETNFE